MRLEWEESWEWDPTILGCSCKHGGCVVKEMLIFCRGGRVELFDKDTGSDANRVSRRQRHFNLQQGI